MKLNILIILLFFGFLISSCCRGKEVERWEIPEDGKQLIQYELGQTINFIDSLGNPFILTVTNNTTSWKKWDLEESHCEYVSVKEKLVTLIPDSDYLSIIYLGIHHIGISGCQNCLIMHLSQYAFVLSYNIDGLFLSDDLYQYFYDSLKINNKFYYDVVEREERHNHRYNENGEFISLPDQLFYNKEYGILQMKIEGRDFFTIDN
ncbi:MAG: hypothetical protein FWH18_07875 [Marinilabiliaceae bacterium]|nr:hypothetical protein [Marinilabiliaceae bacterium]